MRFPILLFEALLNTGGQAMAMTLDFVLPRRPFPISLKTSLGGNGGGSSVLSRKIAIFHLPSAPFCQISRYLVRVVIALPPLLGVSVSLCPPQSKASGP